MVRPSIRHRELHLNKTDLPTKFRQMLPHTFQRSFPREPLAGHSSARKKGLDLPQLLTQPGDRHRQGSVDSRSTPFTPRGQTIAIPKRPQLNALGFDAFERVAPHLAAVGLGDVEPGWGTEWSTHGTRRDHDLAKPRSTVRAIPRLINPPHRNGPRAEVWSDSLS